MLAGLKDEQVEDILFENHWMIVHFGGKKIADIEAMIQRAREVGYCWTDQYFVNNICSLAVAVPASVGRTFAALSIVGQSGAIQEPDLPSMVTMLQQEAKDIATLLNQRGLLV